MIGYLGGDVRLLFNFRVVGDCIPLGRPRGVFRGGRLIFYMPRRSIEYRDVLLGSLRDAVDINSLGLPYRSPVLLGLECDFYIRRRGLLRGGLGVISFCGRGRGNPDLDNLLKAILDAYNGVIYEDDSQVVMLVGRKFFIDSTLCDSGWVDVRVYGVSILGV